jgi:hypothetical protein
VDTSIASFLKFSFIRSGRATHAAALIMLLGGATVVWPLAARAQQPERMRRVGVLLGLAEQGEEAKLRVQAFRLGLRDLGWNEGRNVVLDCRYGASDLGLIKQYVKELVDQSPDVIVGNSSPVLAALHQATTSIPIVFAVVNDPVGQGFISSLARSGGNITGFTFLEFEMVGKWINMLTGVVPNLRRVQLRCTNQLNLRPLTEYCCHSLSGGYERGRLLMTQLRHWLPDLLICTSGICPRISGADGKRGVIWLQTERTRDGKEHDLPLVR